MKTLAIAVIISSILCACAPKAEQVEAPFTARSLKPKWMSVPIPYGPGTYVIYSKTKSAAKAQITAVKYATMWCIENGEVFSPVSSELAARKQFQFIFSCNPIPAPTPLAKPLTEEIQPLVSDNEVK